MEDPHLAVRPDFSSDDFVEARLQLTNDAVNDEQASRILGTLWDIQNAKDIQRWNARKEEEAQMARDLAEQAAEAQAQQQRRLREEEEAALAEERKKNKSKYAPVPDVEVPSGPVNIPAPYATRKLKKGEYCELYFFTNAGLAEAESFNTSVDDEALTLLKSDNGQHVWIPASHSRDKSAIIKDEDLTWEQFGEAGLRLINAMREHDWQRDRIDMHIKFWTALEEHPWRRSPRNHLNRALLLYQSQQRQRWHRAIGTAQGFSLAKLNEEVLKEACEELAERERNARLESLRQVSERYAALTAQASNASSHTRYPSGSKRQLSPPPSHRNADLPDHKRQRSFRNSPPRTSPPSFNGPLPACAVCLGRHRHLVIECRASRTWDNKHETFAERSHKALFAKDGRRICAKWQREEGCSERHDVRHICSGCGLSSHGAQKCNRAQEASSSNTV